MVGRGERTAIRLVERRFPRFGRRRASGDVLAQPVLVRSVDVFCAQGQCFAAGIGSNGDAVMDGRADELIERGTGLEVEEVLVRVRDQEALPFQQSGDAFAEGVQKLGEFVGSRPWGSMKPRPWSFEAVDAIKDQHVAVNLAG